MDKEWSLFQAVSNLPEADRCNLEAGVLVAKAACLRREACLLPDGEEARLLWEEWDKTMDEARALSDKARLLVYGE